MLCRLKGLEERELINSPRAKSPRLGDIAALSAAVSADRQGRQALGLLGNGKLGLNFSG